MLFRSVADASKIPETRLPQTYLYDIPTEPGQEIVLTSGTSFIDEVSAGKEETSSDYFNVLGQKVSKDYRGFVIHNGRKFFNR